MWYVELQHDKGHFFTVSCPLDTEEDAWDWIIEWALVEALHSTTVHNDVFRITNRA
jgi:hypothetical protein